MVITDIFKQAIPIEKAKSLPTKRLLTFYKKYRYLILRVQPEGTWLDCFCGDRIPRDKYDCLKSYFDDIKRILDSRENINE